MTTWRQYEEYIYQQCRIYFPTARIKFNDKVKGKLSLVNRQIDISIRFKTDELDILGVIECKYFNEKINLKQVDSFSGFIEDVGAHFGYLITNKGFSKSAYNRVRNSQLRLKIIPFQELNWMETDVDEIINTSIQSLECTEAVFLMRQHQNSRYTDMANTSLSNRIITYKEGFADLEYFAYKRLLIETARVYRDFPCIEKIKIIIPSQRERRIYTAQTEQKLIEDALQISIADLRTDIKKWREFINNIKKPAVHLFAKTFVESIPYSPPAG